jgi:chromosome segregation ATPase
MESGEERIGLNGAAAVLGVPSGSVRRFVAEGRLMAERGAEGGYSLLLSEVEGLARELQAEEVEGEVFEGEIPHDDYTASRLPAVPFERYERLLQQGQDYKTRLEERNRQIEEVRAERDAARVEMDRLNLIEFQRELQEKTISTLEEEKTKLEADRERLMQDQIKLTEEKSTLSEEHIRVQAELNALKNRGFWSRLFGG